MQAKANEESGVSTLTQQPSRPQLANSHRAQPLPPARPVFKSSLSHPKATTASHTTVTLKASTVPTGQHDKKLLTAAIKPPKAPGIGPELKKAPTKRAPKIATQPGSIPAPPGHPPAAKKAKKLNPIGCVSFGSVQPGLSRSETAVQDGNNHNMSNNTNTNASEDLNEGNPVSGNLVTASITISENKSQSRLSPAVQVTTQAELAVDSQGAATVVSAAVGTVGGTASEAVAGAFGVASPAAATVASAARKRVKAIDVDLEGVKAKHGTQGLESLSVPELQCYLRAHKLAVGGKKVDLQLRLQLVLQPKQNDVMAMMDQPQDITMVVNHGL